MQVENVETAVRRRGSGNSERDASAGRGVTLSTTKGRRCSMKGLSVLGCCVALSGLLVACSADSPPEPQQWTGAFLGTMPPSDIDDLPEAEETAVREASKKCLQPLPDDNPADGPLWTGLTEADLNLYYSDPPYALSVGDDMYAGGPLGRYGAPFWRDPTTGLEDEYPCDWNRSAMIQHAVVKCLAQRYHQAAFDPSLALPFESRERLIGRARFSYIFSMWQAWAEMTQASGTVEVPYLCVRNNDPESDRSLVGLRNENTAEWFAASVVESMEALVELGHRQSEMVAARADERRGEVPELLALQREVFDHASWPNTSYLTALWLLVGKTTTLPRGYHESQSGLPEYCKVSPYEGTLRAAFATADPSLPAPAHWCFYGSTVSSRRPAIQRGLGWIHRLGPVPPADLAARAGRSAIEELGLTPEFWQDAVRYYKEDATLAGLYPDGPAGIRLEVPPFIFRSQIRELLPQSIGERRQTEWDELSVTELLEWGRWFLIEEMKTQFATYIAPHDPFDTEMANARQGLLDVLEVGRDGVTAELGEIMVVVAGAGPTDEAADIIVSGLDEDDEIQLVLAGEVTDRFGYLNGYVCGVHGTIDHLECPPPPFIYGYTASPWSGCEGRCIQWTGKTGRYLVKLNGQFVAFVDSLEFPAGAGGLRVTRVGGALGKAVEDRVRFDSENVSSLRGNALGLMWDMVPPLENSLISDEDPYEDSFSHYLTSAQAAAANASSAASAALDAKNAIETATLSSSEQIADARADEADQLAELCGPGVASCSVPRIDYTMEQMGLLTGLPAAPGPECADAAGRTGVPHTSGFGDFVDTIAGGSSETRNEYLDNLGTSFRCMSAAVVRGVAQTTIYDLPQVLADGVLTDEEGRLFGGETRVVIADIAVGLDEIRLAVEGVRATFQETDTRLEAEGYRLDQLDDFGKKLALQVMVAVGDALAGIAEGALESFGAASVGLMLKLAGEIGLAELEFQHGRSAFYEEMVQFRGEIQEKIARVQSLGIQIDGAYQRVAGGIARLDQAASRVAATLNRAERLSTHATEQLELQRTHANLLLVRALRTASRSFDEGVRKAFVARRAIEFRLGLDLEMERGRHTFVEPPESWINDIFRIAEIGDVTFPSSGGGIDLDLVDYVTRLGLYVDSYPFDHPFTDGMDVAVVSLRDDVIRAQPNCGTMGSGLNLLRRSEDVGHAPWRIVGTDTATGRTILPAGTPPAASGSYGTPLLFDGMTREQEITANDDAAGQHYTFSVWVAPATDTPQAVVMRVRFATATASTSFENDHTVDAGSGWNRISDTWANPYSGPVTITFSIDTRPAGDLPFVAYVWGAQFERSALATNYEPTLDSTATFLADPHAGCAVEYDVTGHLVAALPPIDWNGDDFRMAFSVACNDGAEPVPIRQAVDPACTVSYIDHGRVRCAGATADVPIADLLCLGLRGGVDYYEIPFSFHQAAIAEGDIFAEESFATGNYNYRVDRLAVNVVGTNVRDCSRSDYPAGCYSRAITPYSLVQGGGVWVRNYRLSDVPFSMPAAWIHDAKALAAEVVVTTPLTSSQQALLADTYRSEFRGRPVEGTYLLRLHQTDALEFDNLEDVQLILYYRYWSPSDMSKSARGGGPSDGEE